jgi:serine/threonine protein kinase
MEVVPDERCTAEDIDTGISELLGETIPPQAPPPARFWTEDQVVRFHDHDYRIVARLGSGGVGTTFKVVETDQTTGEELGTYVAKVAHDREVGRRVLRAYSLARSHLPAHTALSTIFEVAKEWRENEFIAVMRWVSGTPLAEFIGVFPLLAEDNQESSAETLALRWLRTTCEALAVLHRNGLVHGDVSPRNLIVSGTELVLTDYDFVQKTDEPKAAPGTLLYSPAAHQESPPASPSDDLYALGTSFFHVVFGREPFRDTRQGLNWGDVGRGDFAALVAFLDRATHADPQSRFANAGDALAFLNTYEPPSQLASAEDQATEQALSPSLAGQAAPQGTPVELSERSVEWLLALLQSYPGSSWGNQETRGLDTEFAARTYVPTSVEERLLLDVRARRLRLAILCGNAGDGKTALLQHVADRLGLGKHQSSERILEGRVTNGPLVRINLDGSAARGKFSADELLDSFLEPFRDGPPSEDLVHLLAINDGRLLEWIQAVELRNGGNPTSLTSELNSSLQGEEPSKDSHVRFINLNQRSLVGGILPDRSKIDTAFLDRLVTHLYGADQARAHWEPCLSCSAKGRCEVFNAARLFGPDKLPSAADANVRARARARLFEALQAVHLRGETHITMRELRAALVYILFGVHNCDDYHAGAEPPPFPYWDRAFAADSPARQGDVLRELARLDPALEAHPQIDRHLLRPSAEDVATLDTAYWPTRAESSHGSALASARRRAYFEWSPEDLERVAGDREALGLGRGRHLREFSNLPLYDDSKIGEVCERLCRGISRLEDLPPEALDRRDVVPLRVKPRTPTETAFWVEKELSAFRLEADVPQEAEGSEVLHRQARLVYRYRNGQEEVLRLGAELFSLLMELADGYQLGDVSTDDAFAHLSIFVQRLAREDERRLLAWNPMQDETVYQVYATKRESEGGVRQLITIESLHSGEPE